MQATVPEQRGRKVTVDGNEAAASVAHRVSEVIAIYPITPSSPMGELADEWSSQRRTNLWGLVPDVVEMLSEAGLSSVRVAVVYRKGDLSSAQSLKNACSWQRPHRLDYCLTGKFENFMRVA